MENAEDEPPQPQAVPLYVSEIEENFLIVRDTLATLESMVENADQIYTEIKQFSRLLSVYTRAFPHFPMDIELAKRLGPGIQRGRDIYEAEDLLVEFSSRNSKVYESLESFNNQLRRTVYTLRELFTTCELIHEKKADQYIPQDNITSLAVTLVPSELVKNFISMSFYAKKNYSYLVSYGTSLQTISQNVLEMFNIFHDFISDFAFDRRPNPSASGDLLDVVEGDELLASNHRKYMHLNNRIHDIVRWIEPYFENLKIVQTNGQKINNAYRLVGRNVSISPSQP